MAIKVTPLLVRTFECGGALEHRSICGIALYSTVDGVKQYEHRCPRCGRVSQRETIGGRCAHRERPCSLKTSRKSPRGPI